MEEKKILNKLKQGDIVELIYIPPKGKKLTLIFDKKVYSNDYGVDYTQWSFQTNLEDMGNSKTAIIYRNGGYFQGILYNSNTLSIAEMGKDIYVDINSKKINYIRGD